MADNKSKQGSEPAQQLPEGKRTTIGLYVTAKDAYEMWQADPDHVKLIDPLGALNC